MSDTESKFNPELKVIVSSDRVFDNFGTPTIKMGDGLTIVSDIVYSDDGLCGICFSENGVNVGIGGDHDNLKGLSTEEIGPYIQILSKNPDSLQVIIDRLNDAIKALRELK